MNRISTSFDLPISLDLRKRSPIYRQLYDWFRGAITEGRLRPGQRVPSSRTLATELSVSRIPVLSAYEQLHAEGYLETFKGAGTCVARTIPDDSLKVMRKPAVESAGKVGSRKISRRASSLGKSAAQSWFNSLGAFRVSLPALDQFPADSWSKLVTRHSKKLTKRTMAYGDAMGYMPFREAIAEYLGTVRAVRCDPSQILVTTGSQQGLQLAAQVLLNPKEKVWMEEPGYPGAQLAFMAAGAELVSIPVDEEGIDIGAAIRRSGRARAVYITPSHQYPLGMTMSATRRMMLLSWAERCGAWVIEDDYDSEYRFGSRPIASLQGLDANARVIYVGTFSKVMFPALRLGYLVIPKDLVRAFAAARDAADIFSSTLYQAVMTDFIREGHFARHIRRMRMLYMERRRALVDAIRDEMNDSFEVVGTEAGMHLVALLPEGIDDVAVGRLAAEKGVSAMPLSSCYRKPRSRGGLILGYGGVSVQQIQEGVRTLKQVVHSLMK